MLANQKARGAFFTPLPIAQFLADWAVRTPHDSVLEPSCGNAVFLEAAGRRIELISHATYRGQLNLRGVEIHPPSAIEARSRLSKLGYDADVICKDFFEVEPEPKFDVALGNPPFIRYQSFSGQARSNAMRAALAQGITLKRLSSAWAPFLIHAAACLKPTGRLGFVLPAELLATHYAAEVRAFLLRRFASLKIILFEELIFPGVMQEVILLLAEGTGGCESFEVIQFKNAECLKSASVRGNDYRPPRPSDKWTTSLLHREAQQVLLEVSRSKYFEPLKNWGDIYLGFVTGNNSFFTLSEDQRLSFKISQNDVLRICPPSARKINRLALTNALWESMRDASEAVYLFYPQSSRLDGGAKQYVEHGQRSGVQNAYKCTNRTPWWRVPISNEPDLIFTYMNHVVPRIISNTSNVHVSNSVYGISLHQNRKTFGRKWMPMLFANSVSALSAEIEGRSYGGGLLKIEPREADRIIVPSLAVVADVLEELRLKDRDDDRENLTSQMDQLILRAANLSTDGMTIVKAARQEMFGRRMTRNKSMKAEKYQS
jgi:adenine-specific DNA methylase